MGACWFCGRGGTREVNAVKIEMSALAEWRVQSLSWRVRSLEVPRCSTCRKAHERARFVGWWGSGLGVVGAVGGWWIAPTHWMLQAANVPAEVFILALFFDILVAGTITALPVSLYYAGCGVGDALLPQGVKCMREADAFPDIVALAETGWHRGRDWPTWAEAAVGWLFDAYSQSIYQAAKTLTRTVRHRRGLSPLRGGR